MFKNRIFSLKKGFLSESVREIIGLLLIIFLIRTFGFGLYQVPSGSMETTMLVGERFFADKFTVLFSPPERGNIISFNDPTYPYSDNWLMKLWQHYVWGPANWTKRVIGQPGDIVKGVIEDGKPVLYRNGEKLDEPYVNKYPLITMCSMDPLTLYALIKEEREALAGFSQSQALFEKVESQTLSRYCEARSYVPEEPYEKQPFYRMNADNIVHVDAQGELTLGGRGKALLRYPEEARYPRANKIIRRGNSYWSGSDEFYVELGPDEYWLMGDNRRGSFDSRFFGPIKKKLIHGKILYRIWSIDSSELWWILDLIKHPIDFFKRARWNRFFQRVH